jgi:hypothetical protein
MDVKEALDRVESKETFLDFVAALRDDTGNVGWENGSIETFLDAMHAWASGTSGLTGKPMVSEQASWHTFAEILHAGKFYE